MDFVAFAQAAQDADGVFHRRLADHHGLEPPLERRVLLDVLAVFVERRGANRVQLAAGQHRLQHVRGVHRAFGRARADDGVELVDEQHHLALGIAHFLEHRLQPILELAAVLRAGDQRSHVEGDDALVFEAFRHVAADDALGEAFDDGGLADAGFADQHRVVLGAARQHLDDAADFLVAPDHRIQLALAGQLRQVAAVLLEGLVLVFGIRIGDALAAAHAGERFEHPLARHAALLQLVDRDGAAGLAQDAQQQVLGAHILVLHGLGFGLRGIEHDAHARGEVRLRSAVRLRLLAEMGAQRLGERAGIHRNLAEHGRHDAVLLLDERDQQVLGLHLRMLEFGSELRRGHHRLLRLFSELVEVHVSCLVTS